MKLLVPRDLYRVLVVGLMILVRWRSSPGWAATVARSVAWVAYRCSRTNRGLRSRSLRRAFGDGLSETQRRAIVKGSFREVWYEMFSSAASRREAIPANVSVHGVDHLQSALDKGRGVILWESANFGGRTLAKRILRARGFSIHQVHGGDHMAAFHGDHSPDTWLRERIVKPWFERCARTFVDEVIRLPRSDSLAFTRLLQERLRKNKIICIAGDGGWGWKRVPVAFLGHTKGFSTGMLSLARITGASILPMFCVRNSDGTVSLTIEGPIRMDPTVDRERDLETSVAEYAGLLESYVRRYPEQYRGWHDPARDERDRSSTPASPP